MPRNFSIKQTMLKESESLPDRPVVIGSPENPTIIYVKNKTVDEKPQADATAQKTVEKKLEKPEDEVIRFDHPNKEKDNKKWYQFWK